MAPRHTQVLGRGRHVLRRHISRPQQTKSWCVGSSFPPPAYAGIRPTLFLFGFRADALNANLSNTQRARRRRGLREPARWVWPWALRLPGPPRRVSEGSEDLQSFRVLPSRQGRLQNLKSPRARTARLPRLRDLSKASGRLARSNPLGSVVGCAFFGLRPYQTLNFSIF